MSSQLKYPALSVASNATGANITTSAASASAALPNASSGQRPRFVRVSVTVAAHVRLGTAGLTAVGTDMLVTPDAPVILQVQGHTHIAAIQNAAAGTVNVYPLED